MNFCLISDICMSQYEAVSRVFTPVLTVIDLNTLTMSSDLSPAVKYPVPLPLQIPTMHCWEASCKLHDHWR